MRLAVVAQDDFDQRLAGLFTVCKTDRSPEVAPVKSLTLTLALSAAIASCSGADTTPSARTVTVTQSPRTSPTDSASSRPSEPRPGIREAVQGYSDAFLTGDANSAWAYLSDRCQYSIPEAQYDAIVRSAGTQYGTALVFSTWRASVHGSNALVSYTYARAPEIDQTAQQWVFDGAEWRYDAC